MIGSGKFFRGQGSGFWGQKLAYKKTMCILPNINGTSHIKKIITSKAAISVASRLFEKRVFRPLLVIILRITKRSGTVNRTNTIITITVSSIPNPIAA